MQTADVLLIGAGALGLATAFNLQKMKVRRVLVIDKEHRVAFHQTGRNSGVLHSGIYYEPGSLRAKTCQAGRAALEQFCAEEGVAYERCGKVVVATGAAELPRLTRLEERARANNIRVEAIGPERLRELEPAAAGQRALHVPDTGIVDFVGVCKALARRIECDGGALGLGTAFLRARETRAGMLIETSRGPVEAKMVVSCAGLQADRVARAQGISPGVRIVPFRGEYHLLGDRGPSLVKNLVYPVPDPQLPFLGVHFTRRFDGSIDCGPNALLALGREQYGTVDLDRELYDAAETLGYPGFWRLALAHLGYGWGELYRHLHRRALVAELQRLIPEVRSADLLPGPSGIRAQAVTSDGRLHADFFIEEQHRAIAVLNAPSPAATASLQIGRLVAERVCAQLL